MVPPAFPRPDLLVTATGVLEIAGAVGLMLPIAAPYAALGLCFMLTAVFPANVHAARQHLSIAGRPVEALFQRAPMTPLEHDELLAKDQVLHQKSLTRTQKANQRSEAESKETKHNREL